MSLKVDCFIIYENKLICHKLINQLLATSLVNKIYLLSNNDFSFDGCYTIVADEFHSCATIRQIAKLVQSDFVFLALEYANFELRHGAIDRMVQVAISTDSPIVYSDYHSIKDDVEIENKLIDYQAGSLRENFDFGPAKLYRSEVLKAFRYENYEMLKYAGSYALRLRASRMGSVVHIPESLFMLINQKNEIANNDLYLNNNLRREIHVEFEQVCSSHLRDIGAILIPPYSETLFPDDFETEVSIVIVVKNNVETIRDAIISALIQSTSFSYNIIVVDNYSTDGTSEILKEYEDLGKIIRIVPVDNFLELGGCYNEAVFSNTCGKFVIQLDPNDLLADNNTLQTIIDKFYEENCAMVVGSYRITNFQLKQISPGIIDHREWTEDNGGNNALRMNDFGKPKAFYTPILRKIRFPNVGVETDYAVALAISGQYKVSRVYQPVYLLRQWERKLNPDLEIRKNNDEDFYFDRIKSFEIQKRIFRNKNNEPD